MARTNTLGSYLLAVTWSLAVEEQFYLSLPIIIRFFSGRRLHFLVLSGIVLAPILRTVLLFAFPRNWVAAFVLMPCRADALLFGVLAAILLRKEDLRELFRRNTRHFAIVFVVLVAGIAFLTLRFYSAASPLMQRIGYTWIALFYSTVLVFVLTHPDNLLSTIFRSAALRWLGTLAYCTYLVHQAVKGFVYGLFWGREPAITSVHEVLASLFALACTLTIAALSWRYFESPLIRQGHRLAYRSQKKIPSALASTVENSG
jgi:peptidoglycan/LPS O-acetylase OafA/YrhL